MGSETCEDSDSGWSDEELGDSGSLLDFFSGGPSTRSPEANDDDGSEAHSTSLYSPLENYEIRLIILDHAAEFTDPIHCRFKKTSIRWPAPYTALSYAWGDIYDDGSHLTHAVFCDGTPLKITKTLHEALRRMRQDRSEVILCFWIDAICINQADHVERSAQVMIMDKIYSNAKGLLIWLGEEDMFADLSEGLEQEIEERATSSVLTATKMVRQNIRSARWFGRRWVIQGAASCRNAHVILVGGTRYPVANVVDILGDWMKRPSSAALNTPKENVLRSRTLFANLISFRDAMCSDDRDRIYALRNVSSDGDHLPIDYSKTADELYIHLAQLWMLAGYTSNVLSMAAEQIQRHPRSPSPTLPSWVPDWRLPFKETWYSSIKDGPSLSSPGPSKLDAQYICNPNMGLSLRCRGWLFPKCLHYGRDKIVRDPASPSSGRQMLDCCRLLLNSTIYHNLALIDGVRVSTLDAVFLTERRNAFGLILAGRSGGDGGENVWTLLGTQERPALFQGRDGWYLHAIDGAIRLPEPGYVQLI